MLCFNLFVAKSSLDITLMAAVLPTAIPIHPELLTAIRAYIIVVGSVFDQFQVAIPPFVPALVAAEYLPFAFRILSDIRSAVFTGCIFCIRNRRFCQHRSIAIKPMPAAVGFDCVQFHTHSLGYLSVIHTS